MNEPVPAALAGERLDRAVSLLWQCSRAEAAALVSAGAVRLNGAVSTERSARIAAGDELAVAADALGQRRRAAEPHPEAGTDIVVVHEDPHLVVVDKPAGLVVHPGAGRTSGTLCAGLLARYPEMAEVGERTRPGIVHRLDAGTSGLLVTARTAMAYESLVGQLAARTVERRYEALCWGALDDDRGVIDAPVGRSGRRPTQMAVTERGRPARTAYEVQRRYRSPMPVTYLWCRLETGRTHQVRVHLSAIGHPVVGDGVYGTRGATGGGQMTDPAGATDGPASFRRPALHAARLGFSHPDTGSAMLFEASLPPDMTALLAGLS